MALRGLPRSVAPEGDGSHDPQAEADRHGFIKISRKADADPLWREPREFSRWEAWEYMIRAAAYAPHVRTIGTEQVPLARGEFLASLRYLSECWQWSVKRVRRFLEWLMSDGRIVCRRRHSNGTVYLLVNYDIYQSKGRAKGTARAQGVSQKGHSKGHTNDTAYPSVVNGVIQSKGTAKGTAKGIERAQQGTQRRRRDIEEGKRIVAPRTTWMTPYWDLWQEIMGAPPIAGKLATFLKPIHDTHGPDHVVPRLRRYLTETDPQYLSVSRFAETYAKWDPALDPDNQLAFPYYPNV